MLVKLNQGEGITVQVNHVEKSDSICIQCFDGKTLYATDYPSGGATQNSLQQLKAEIALLLNTWDNTTMQQFLDTWALRINKLRQLSAV